MTNEERERILELLEPMEVLVTPGGPVPTVGEAFGSKTPHPVRQRALEATKKIRELAEGSRETPVLKVYYSERKWHALARSHVGGREYYGTSDTPTLAIAAANNALTAALREHGGR